LQGRRTWLQLLCVTLARTRCSSAAFSASCDAIRIGLPPPRAERFRSTLADALAQISPDLRLRLAAPHSPPSASPRTEARSHRGHLHILREQSTMPLDLNCYFPFNSLRRSPRATLLPPGRVRPEPSRCNISTSVHASARCRRSRVPLQRPRHVARVAALHTGVSLFPCRSTPSRQYYVTPPPAFACLRAIACRGLALAPHAPQLHASQAAPAPDEPLARTPPTAPPAPSAPASRSACASLPGRLCLLWAALLRPAPALALRRAPAQPGAAL
jgi:hypothetical protein